jgi:hypothetical protein
VVAFLGVILLGNWVFKMRFDVLISRVAGLVGKLFFDVDEAAEMGLI